MPEQGLECMKCYPPRHNITMPLEYDSPIISHPGTQLILGQHRQLVWKNLPKVSTLVANRTRYLSLAKWVGYPLHHTSTVVTQHMESGQGVWGQAWFPWRAQVFSPPACSNAITLPGSSSHCSSERDGCKELHCKVQWPISSPLLLNDLLQVGKNTNPKNPLPITKPLKLGLKDISFWGLGARET